MHFDPVTREVRVKPMPEDRVTAAGHLFFKLRQRAPEPFNKLGELIGNFDEVMHDVRLIGGRSVWEGDVPSKTWTPGRVYQTPPGWQPGQRETNEEYEEWLEEHIKIHEYQMANARKWDEKIVRGDRNWRDGDGASRRRPHRHARARQQREREEEREREEAHRWPTSAEELQAKLMAEWKAEEAANTLASPAAAPKPGGLPPRIPGVEQPPPPPGSPPKPTTARKKSPETRRARRASTAAAVAMFRDSGDI